MDLEQDIQGLRAKGDLHGAATRAIQGYGPEVYGFLVTLVGSERDASEIFSQACEDMWIALGNFRGRCSMRTWFYVLAKHAAARFRRAPHLRPGRHLPLSEVGELAERVRSGTARYLRTDARDLFATIRDELADDDRALLVLRLDRAMKWSEIAHAFSPDDDSDEALRRTSMRLRKRFQVLKEEIRERARAAGLLGDPES